MEISPGTLNEVPSIETLYPAVHLGITDEVLNQIAVVYDTRDDATHSVAGYPMGGAYAGVNGHEAHHHDSIYSMVGFDGRTFLPDYGAAGHGARGPSGRALPAQRPRYSVL